MTRVTGKSATVLVASLCAVVLSLSLARAQESGAQESGVSGGDVSGGGVPIEEVHLGAGSCAAQACHGGGFPERMEYKVWATKDPHSNAFTTLGSALGQRIAKRLGIDATESDRCLNCHGTTGVKTADTFDQTDGVSCEQCHGGAKEWLGPHVDADWRERPPEIKARQGLHDLSTAKKRADLCVTCHVCGPGREIGHEIMAAGHPPLVFDAAKQIQDMHPHWHPQWKGERDMTFLLWVEGLRAGAVAELRRIGRTARDKRNWMEFAVFDCYACHHPIYQGTAYETRPATGQPGNLPLDLSTLRVLVRLTGDRALEDAAAPILRRTVRPSEDPRKLANEAERAADRLASRQLAAIELQREPRKLADTWLAKLEAWLSDKSVPTIPPHLMQQLAMAVDVLVPNRLAEGYREAYAALLRSVDPKTHYDAKASATLALKALAAGR